MKKIIYILSAVLFIMVAALDVLSELNCVPAAIAGNQPAEDVATIIGLPTCSSGVNINYVGFLKNTKKHVPINANTLKRPLTINDEIVVTPPTTMSAWWNPK